MILFEMRVQAKRVYQEPSRGDGVRVLVDRLWPRGIRKDALKMDRWAREVAPSPELRKWYGHVPERFEEFRERYLAELEGGEQRAACDELVAMAKDRMLTLLTATRDLERSGAEVLAEHLAPR